MITAYPLSFLRELESKYTMSFDHEFKTFIDTNEENKHLNYIEVMEGIINQVSDIMNIPTSIIIGRSRQREYVLLRQLLIWHFYRTMPVTMCNIGLTFGGRNHSTIIHSIRMIEDLIETKDHLLIFYIKKLEDILV